MSDSKTWTVDTMLDHHNCKYRRYIATWDSDATQRKLIKILMCKWVKGETAQGYAQLGLKDVYCNQALHTNNESVRVLMRAGWEYVHRAGGKTGFSRKEWLSILGTETMRSEKSSGRFEFDVESSRFKLPR
jgi:hypothetical protein